METRGQRSGEDSFLLTKDESPMDSRTSLSETRATNANARTQGSTTLAALYQRHKLMQIIKILCKRKERRCCCSMLVQRAMDIESSGSLDSRFCIDSSISSHDQSRLAESCHSPCAGEYNYIHTVSLFNRTSCPSSSSLTRHWSG